MTRLRTARNQRGSAPGDRYKWMALANTTASMFMATLDGSIVIIALPAVGGSMLMANSAAILTTRSPA